MREGKCLSCGKRLSREHMTRIGPYCPAHLPKIKPGVPQKPYIYRDIEEQEDAKRR